METVREQDAVVLERELVRDAVQVKDEELVKDVVRAADVVQGRVAEDVRQLISKMI